MSRGVRQPNAEALVDDHAADRVTLAIAWFDEQTPGSVGPGVLVAAVREGREPKAPRSFVAQQRDYGDEICDWLAEQFPEFTQASGRPHPAAVSAVIRIHFRVGKGRITKRQHGREIRDAVKAWEWRESGGFTERERELIAQRRAERAR